MLRNWNFQLPTEIEFGRGTVRRLGTVAKRFGSKALLVGYADRSAMETTYERAERALKDSGVEYAEFFKVLPEPNDAMPQKGAAAAIREGADMVVALGGGSVIDTAKGIAALAKMEGHLWDYSQANPDSSPVVEALPTIAAPTTAGTGSEVTAIAVFAHRDRGALPRDPLKSLVVGPAIRPKLALVDPDLTLTCPAELTAACGADAMGHAIEACLSRNGNPISTSLANEAISLVMEHLPRAVESPDDPEPREPLALASTLAGIAFENAGLTVGHSIAQALGALLHVPHGQAVAISTLPCLRYNAEKGDDIQCRGCSDTASFIDRLERLYETIGLPARAKVPAGAPDDLVERLAANAIESTPLPIRMNPRKLKQPQVEDLVAEMLEG